MTKLVEAIEGNRLLAEQEVPKNTVKVIPLKPDFTDRVRGWVACHAFKLLVLAVFFPITWVWVFLLEIGVIPHG